MARVLVDDYGVVLPAPLTTNQALVDTVHSALNKTAPTPSTRFAPTNQSDPLPTHLNGTSTSPRHLNDTSDLPVLRPLVAFQTVERTSTNVYPAPQDKTFNTSPIPTRYGNVADP